MPPTARRRRWRGSRHRSWGSCRKNTGHLRNGPWNGFAGYDRWFGQEINNATLASVGIYTELVAAFEALLARNGGDLPLFYGEVKRLAALPKDDRQARLARVLAAVTQSAEFRAR